MNIVFKKSSNLKKWFQFKKSLKNMQEMTQHNKSGEINKLKEVKLNNKLIYKKLKRKPIFKKRKIRSLKP